MTSTVFAVHSMTSSAQPMREGGGVIARVKPPLFGVMPLRDAIERLFGRHMKTTHEGLAKVIGSPYRPCRRDAYYF
jgi:hypothetical protein